MKISLADLENIASTLSIKVTYEDLKASKGGSCRVLETRRIIINKHLHSNEKINLLAKELGNFDLTGLKIPDWIRKQIDREAAQRSEFNR